MEVFPPNPCKDLVVITPPPPVQAADVAGAPAPCLLVASASAVLAEAAAT